MEILILVFVIIVFVETSFLLIKERSPFLNKSRKIFIDTSVLIDGRILGLARTGFLEGEYIILRSVLRELQLLADSKDSDKRTRAREGLEAVAELEKIANVKIPGNSDIKVKVDEQLLKYAHDYKGAILTLDYNLIKVAEAEGVDVLNINDLAMAVRSEYLPGEKLKIKITDKGANRGQGIGHMSDGTMVVVEKASGKIGRTVTIELERFHETPAGRILFARLVK